MGRPRASGFLAALALAGALGGCGGSGTVTSQRLTAVETPATAPDYCYQPRARVRLAATTLTGPNGMQLAGDNVTDFSGGDAYGCNQRDIRFAGQPVAISGEDQFVIDVHMSFYASPQALNTVATLAVGSQTAARIAGANVLLFDGHGEAAARFILGATLFNITYACAGQTAAVAFLQCESPVPAPGMIRSWVVDAAQTLIPQLRTALA
jgi:prepilin-type processing-associated H-X9-DG protein